MMFTPILLAAAMLQNQANDPPLAQGLGTYSRKIATNNPLAQRYFDQGLAYYYGFNHHAARRSFEKAASLDPHCAMAYWGIAMSCGPNINDPEVDPERAKAAWDALQKIAGDGMEVAPEDKPLIDAIEVRFVEKQPDDRSPLDKAFADKMRDAYKAEPHDPDVAAVFAESMMDLRPWHLWSTNGDPAPGTQEIVDCLQKTLKEHPNHPFANHLYIHAVEASPHPEWAMESANRLRDMEPGLGHMVHMPSHIDVRTGKWKEAIIANRKAIAMDNAFLKKNPNPGIYVMYMAHNRQMLAYACMMRGQSKEAIQAVSEVQGLCGPDFQAAQPALYDMVIEMPYEMMVRFGKWDEILAAPDPGSKYPFAFAVWHASRGMAYSAKGDIASARKEQAEFREAAKKVPADEALGMQTGAAMMAVEEHLLDGEISYREGKLDGAIDELRKAVDAEDQLSYDEPPDWLIPTRHTLGATLMDAHRYGEAMLVYRQDLRRLPNNGWSLYGMYRCLHEMHRDRDAQQYLDQFQKVWADADMSISSSCMCLPAKPSGGG